MRPSKLPLMQRRGLPFRNLLYLTHANSTQLFKSLSSRLFNVTTLASKTTTSFPLPSTKTKNPLTKNSFPFFTHFTPKSTFPNFTLKTTLSSSYSTIPPSSSYSSLPSTSTSTSLPSPSPSPSPPSLPASLPQSPNQVELSSSSQAPRGIALTNPRFAQSDLTAQVCHLFLSLDSIWFI